MSTLQQTEGPVRARLPGAVWWLTVAALAIVAVVPLVGNQGRVQDWDPQFARVIVERVHRFGGTFYENGIYNKGPLELVVYNVARHLGGYDGMWHLVSVFAAAAALVSAAVAARTAQWSGAGPAVALATGVAVYFHLVLSPSDYSGVLYARNITVALLAVAWLVTFEERFWRSPRSCLVTCAVAGGLLGLVAQTLIAEAFSAAVIGLALVYAVSRRAGSAARPRLMAVAIGSAAAAFASAPVWYLLRGRFEEYWASWYGHAQLMSAGTRRSLASQFALGWDQIYAYYRQHPLAALAVVAFALLAYATWPTATWRARLMNVTLLAWFAASWLEQVLNQRYSSHYFVVNTVPTALMIAVLAGHGWRAASRNPRIARLAVALPLVTVLGTLYISGPDGFRDATKRTSRFTSFAATAREQARDKAGPVQAVRGVLDLVSRDNDPILAWTGAPWPYLDVRRVAAGRFIWKSFLMGEIYLGGSGPEYVLPHTWKWFREDVRRSNPAAFVKTDGDPAPGTPFDTLVKRQFQLAYPGQQPVYLRTDIAGGILTGPAGKPWAPPPGASTDGAWKLDQGSVTYRGTPGAGSSDAVTLAGHGCVRIDGLATTQSGALPGFDVRLADDQAKRDGGSGEERPRLRLWGERAASGTEAGDYEVVPSGLQAVAGGPVRFSLVVGRRAAALVVEGQIRAAVRVPPSVAVSVTSLEGSLVLSELRLSEPPPATGC